MALESGSAVPRYLYKYRSLGGENREFARDLIVNQRLYFAQPSQLNDPFEFKPVLSVEASKAEKAANAKRIVSDQMAGEPRPDRRRLVRNMMDNPKELITAMENIVDVVGVYSMSANPVNLLMWPHYAADHTGVCVRFESAALAAEVDTEPGQVQYVSDRPHLNLVKEINDQMPVRVALTKGADWEYEQEWRLLLPDMAGKLRTLSRPVVSGVILGMRISKSDEAEVLRWVAAARREIGVFRASIHPHKYALDLRPVQNG